MEYRINISDIKIPRLDVLAIAPHPDDAELFCGGTLIKLLAKGYKVGIIDLTLGEASSRGTQEERLKETKHASDILGISFRANLRIPDLSVNQESEISRFEQIERLTIAIRAAKPDLLLAPFGENRHPDHEGARLLTQDAIFRANVATQFKDKAPVHQVAMTAWYMCRKEFKADFIVDVSDTYEKKMEAIGSYKSQVGSSSKPDAPITLVSDPVSLHSIRARDAYYGSQIGVEYGEAFSAGGPLRIDDPIQYIRQTGSIKRFISAA